MSILHQIQGGVRTERLAFAMAISRSDMSCFISHVLEKRYQAALQHLQSTLSTFEPRRYLLARLQASNMLCVIAAKCNTMNKTPAECGERLQLLQFLIDCYSITGDAEKKLTARLELLNLRQSKSAYLHSDAENSFQDWMSFGRDCVTQGYYGNGVKAFDMATKWGSVSNGLGEQTEARRLVAEAKLEKYHTMKLKNIRTVQAQAEELILGREIISDKDSSKKRSYSEETATDRFLEGIKRRNLHKLKQLQSQKI